MSLKSYSHLENSLSMPVRGKTVPYKGKALRRRGTRPKMRAFSHTRLDRWLNEHTLIG